MSNFFYWRDAFAFVDNHNGAVTVIATVFICFFTFVLAIITRRQAILTRESINLARDEFVATHRPRIIVRFIATSYLNGHQSVDVHVVNIGESAATIRELGCGLARRKERDWLTRGITGDPKQVDPIVLVSGERHVFEKAASITYADAEIFGDAIDGTGDERRTIETCAFGSIRYTDETGIERETGFFRVYDPSSEKFIASQDPGEEYQD